MNDLDPHTSRPIRLEAATAPRRAEPMVDPIRGALVDSRQRWRELVVLSADLAFETDAWGRFVFIFPDQALGWPAGSLIGQSASVLLPDPTGGSGFDPFRTAVPARRKRVWLKRGDGGLACLGLAAAPVLDAAGSLIGVRGAGVDMTEYDQQGAQVAAALRRGEVLDLILRRTGKEVLAPQMMAAALDALVSAVGAEGAAVVVVPEDGTPPTVSYQSGAGAADILLSASGLLPATSRDVTQTTSLNGRPILVAGCHPRFGDNGGLAIWRAPTARPWDTEERMLVGSATNIIRMVLEHESIQSEMNRLGRTDPLTGLLNRRAFIEEVNRQTDRLDREHLPGTLMFADLDHFKAVNDQMGHEAGDKVLLRAASLLRQTVRPSDLVARLGGDEFAVWMGGADHMTVAERADHLREVAPHELGEVVGGDAPRMSLSLGIASRRAGSQEPLDSLMRRADMAMYEVKRNGRGHWRVSLEEPA